MGGSKKRITKRDLLILELHKQGKSTTRIAKEIGMTQGGVFYVLKKLNVNTSISREQKRKLNQKYLIDESYFECIDSSDKAYIFGLLCADGYIKKNKKQFGIGLTDAYLIDIIKEKLKYSGKLTTEENGRGYANTKPIRKILISNYKISEDLIRHGMVLNKTTELKMPSIHSNLFGDFLRGFFDGDGSLSLQKQYNLIRAHFSIISTTSFCLALKSILDELSIKSWVIKHKGTNKEISRVNSSCHEDIIKLYKLMYCQNTSRTEKIFLKRKHDKFIEFFQNRKRVLSDFINKYTKAVNDLPVW